jgi:hypothetical protein
MKSPLVWFLDFVKRQGKNFRVLLARKLGYSLLGRLSQQYTSLYAVALGADMYLKYAVVVDHDINIGGVVEVAVRYYDGVKLVRPEFPLDGLDEAARPGVEQYLRSLQLGRLLETLARVYRTVPLYRQKLDEAGVKPSDVRSLEDLNLLPFLTKQDMREFLIFETLYNFLSKSEQTFFRKISIYRSPVTRQGLMIHEAKDSTLQEYVQKLVDYSLLQVYIDVDEKYQEVVREVNNMRNELPSDIYSIEIQKWLPSN